MSDRLNETSAKCVSIKMNTPARDFVIINISINEIGNAMRCHDSEIHNNNS